MDGRKNHLKFVRGWLEFRRGSLKFRRGWLEFRRGSLKFVRGSLKFVRGPLMTQKFSRGGWSFQSFPGEGKTWIKVFPGGT